MHAFWQHGYDGTSMRTLLAATGLSKSSFYQAFDSKHDAFKRAFSRYCDELVVELRAQLGAATSALVFIEGVLTTAAAEATSTRQPRGCMIVNVASEFSSRDLEVRRDVQNGVRRVTRVLVEAVRQAQSEGTVASDGDAQALGRYLLSSLAGLRTMVKAGAAHTTLRDIVAVTLSALR